jgi:hypothetical protein
MFVLPTWNRPEKLEAFFAAAKETNMTSPGAVFLQGKDQLEKYEAVLKNLPSNWICFVGETNIGLVSATNWVISQFKNETWYGLLCDDMLPKTQNWDTKLIKLAKDWNFVSCWDDSVNAHWRATGIMVLGGRLARTTGFILPPCCWHICGDDWWQVVGKALSIWKVAADVAIESGMDREGPDVDETQQSAHRDFGVELIKYHRWLSEYGADVIERLRVMLQAHGALSDSTVGKFVVSDAA